MSDNFEKDFQRLNASLKKIATSLNDRQVNLRLARKLREIVYRRVKSGFGVTSDKDGVENVNRQQLKALSRSYIDYRKGVAIFFTGKHGQIVRLSSTTTKRNFIKTDSGGQGVRTTKQYNEKLKITPPILGEFGRPEKSNLTLSGQMLDSITVDAGAHGFRIFIPDTARRRVHPKQKDSGLTNKQVAELVSVDRPFMALTDGEVRILVQEMEKIIAEQIKKLIR